MKHNSYWDRFLHEEKTPWCFGKVNFDFRTEIYSERIQCSSRELQDIRNNHPDNAEGLFLMILVRNYPLDNEAVRQPESSADPFIPL